MQGEKLKSSKKIVVTFASHDDDSTILVLLSLLVRCGSLLVGVVEGDKLLGSCQLTMDAQRIYVTSIQGSPEVRKYLVSRITNVLGRLRSVVNQALRKEGEKKV